MRPDRSQVWLRPGRYVPVEHPLGVEVLPPLHNTSGDVRMDRTTIYRPLSALLAPATQLTGCQPADVAELVHLLRNLIEGTDPMSTVPLHGAYDDMEPEPTAEQLAEIEREMPVIEAEMAMLDTEIRILTAEGGPSPLDWRRLRRARRQTLASQVRLARELTAGSAGPGAA